MFTHTVCSAQAICPGNIESTLVNPEVSNYIENCVLIFIHLPLHRSVTGPDIWLALLVTDDRYLMQERYLLKLTLSF